MDNGQWTINDGKIPSVARNTNQFNNRRQVIPRYTLGINWINLIGLCFIYQQYNNVL